MNVMLSSPEDQYKVIAADGASRNWLCPTKSASRTLLKNLVEEVTSQYDIDGFMFDYIRYESDDVCYCPECHMKFENDTGITVTNWPTSVANGGQYHDEFMEWRTKPINELVRDMRNWMLAIKPNLQFSAAVWGWEPGYPDYNRYWKGQDSTYWVKEGYLDWVAPMVYTSDLERLRNLIRDYQQYMVAGPEGKIPLVAFLSNQVPSLVDPQQFNAMVDTVRSEGVDGWIIWRYGGPGDGEGSGSPDIRPYLDIVDLHPRFSLNNILALPTSNSCTIKWITELPATSIVEYAKSPLFTESFVYNPGTGFSYWNIDHISGTNIEDSALVTSHNITLTNLEKGTKYYYRVQSQDQYGNATSEVYTFEL